MDDIRDLKTLQLDALREVENIGAGHAATALSQMTNRRIMITVPEISVSRLEDVAGLLGKPDEIVAAVLLHMLGDLTGRTLLVFPETAARNSPVRYLGTDRCYELLCGVRDLCGNMPRGL